MKTQYSSLIKSTEERVNDFKALQKEGLIPLDGEFFPSVHYPPITMYPLISRDELFRGYTVPVDGFFDVYAHIPFCIRHCAFCHYPVLTGDIPAEKDQYLAALEKEMDLVLGILGLERIKTRSILVGGGTPTDLSPLQFKRFMDFFTARLDMSAKPQFSFDVDPSTLLGPEGAQRIKIMKDHGVNRLTIGLQSLHDDILRMMNRAHTAKEAAISVEIAKDHGFIVNTEFIFGYPGQTMELWAEDMEKAAGLGADEIQLYRLKVVPYGDFEGRIKHDFLSHPELFPGVERTIAMKQLAILFLESKGYNENLRRVFSKERNIFSHYADNQCCGLLDEIGFGLTAFSSMRDRFGLNTQDFNGYFSAIDKGEVPLNRGLVRTADDQMRWCLILPLKNRKVYKKYFEKLTGRSLDTIFRKKIARLKDRGLLKEDEKVLELTKLGAFFADEVSEQFHNPKYIPFPRECYSDGPLNPYNDPNP